jgi:hypothetical protein
MPAVDSTWAVTGATAVDYTAGNSMTINVFETLVGGRSAKTAHLCWLKRHPATSPWYKTSSGWL